MWIVYQTIRRRGLNDGGINIENECLVMNIKN